MAAKPTRECINCGSVELREDLPLNRLGISYLSGIVVKTKPLSADICLQCGHVDLHLAEPHVIKGKEVVQRPTTNFLPFVLFALFILSLQLDS